MVGWAWLTCLLALPEMVAKMALKTKVVGVGGMGGGVCEVLILGGEGVQARSWEETWAYREVCAVGGAFSIAGLMVCHHLSMPSMLSMLKCQETLGYLLVVGR